MGRFGKWIGAGLGWTIGGPIGALLGFAFGSVLDTSTLEKAGTMRGSTTTGDFMVSLMVLFAATMKADNRVLKSELDFIKKYLNRSFDERETIELLKVLRNLLKQEIPVQDVCIQIRRSMDYASRLQLIHLLFGLAMSDGSLAKVELQQIERIALLLGIKAPDIRSLRNMFLPSTEWAYQVLEVQRDVSDDALKKAYRRLALKNHPDKVAYLGEEIRKKAEEKFQRITQAYEAIKKERGLT
jgi:DnaJ like chaperone protein